MSTDKAADVDSQNGVNGSVTKVTQAASMSIIEGSHAVTPNRRERRRLWQDFALGAGSLLGGYFSGVEDLHFGLWEDGEQITLASLPAAQRRYTDFVTDRLAKGANHVLDVGCGNGHFAETLIKRGHLVTCVSPNTLLNKLARAQLGARVEVVDARFEQVGLEEHSIDVMLFSESFQYIDMSVALQKAQTLLRPGGRVVICDFFRRPGSGASPISGGHRWDDFRRCAASHEFAISKDIDITAQVAPTFDLINDVFSSVIAPLYSEAITTFQITRPVISKVLLWTYRRRLQKFQRKYLEGQRTAAAFAKHKTYRFVELRRLNEAKIAC